MRIIGSSEERRLRALLDRRPGRDPALERRVARIVARVRAEGDAALLSYARRFDGLTLPFEVGRSEMEDAARGVPPEVKAAIRTAARRIAAVARRQMPGAWSLAPVPGVRVAQRALALDRVGCYVPGGRHPLPSSLLMTAIPARVAGVREIVAICPRPAPVVMFAALAAGVSRLFRAGGAHAIAALAYGTATVPRVDKIVGPGSAWVAAAKARVAADCGVDFFAGPSELAVVSTRGRAAWIAADLIAQAEHDPDARVVLFTPARRLAEGVLRAVRRALPPRGAARSALSRNGGIVLTRSLDEAISLSERMAPEHVLCDSTDVAGRLARAGTIFVGNYSAPACGDYVTGSNHVLPTMGVAAVRGGLSAADFVRVVNVQRISRAGLRRIGRDGIALATAEGLPAHAASIRLRLDPSERSQS
jgi:histidinol dehydrogenase